MRRGTSTCIKTSTALVILIFVLVQFFITPKYIPFYNQGATGQHDKERQNGMGQKETENENILAVNSEDVAIIRRLSKAREMLLSAEDKVDDNHNSINGNSENNSNDINNDEIRNNSENRNNDNEDSGNKDLKSGQNSLAGEREHGLPNDSNSREESSFEKFNISEIMLNIEEANREQAIRNDDIFGPITNDTVIILIQVHNRLTYLRHLITSLSLSRDIDNTLLIFSHDVWDEEINKLVRLINFSAVMQIFYPFSLQTHPHSFPGESRRDCPRDAKKPQAAAMNCINKDWPDLAGHYREAKFTQTKHHWWWKANQVFDKLSITSNFQGTVLFLEEDHYVAEDFLYVLKLMEAERKRTNQQNTHSICLGTYLKKESKVYKKDTKVNSDGAKTRGLLPHGHPKRSVGQVPLFRGLKTLDQSQQKRDKDKEDLHFVKEEQLGQKLRKGIQRQLLWIHTSFINSVLSVFHKVESSQWISSKHNMGMTLNREQWNKIKACSSQFCQYDDYNWDWSLQHVSLNCFKEKLQVLMIKGPRVFHIGECGVHHKKSDCETSKVLLKVKSILGSAAEFLFPERLAVVKSTSRKKIKLKKGNGGWGDKRDHALCLNMSWTGNN